MAAAPHLLARCRAQRGFGVDVTHLNWSVLVDTTGRTALCSRQSPRLPIVALTDERGPVAARGAWAYQSATIASYGDGLPDGLGDASFYAHSQQIDASVRFTVRPHLQLQLQGLNVTNAVFGFFPGTPAQYYSIQREYYGRTLDIGAEDGF